MSNVYAFDAEIDFGALSPKELLGGKGAGLAEMTRQGIPVPPGFTMTTDVCRAHQETGQLSEDVRAEVERELANLEGNVGKRLGNADAPLLVSVRSGAAISMPGMMDTILNLGLNDETVEGLARITNDPRFAYDAYRRLLQMYGNVVLNVDHHRFEETLTQLKSRHGFDGRSDADVSADCWKEVCAAHKATLAELGTPFPQDTRIQLFNAIEAVFASWGNIRAVRYRQMQGIPHDGGTACNIQAMVFGNRGPTSGSGVAFTRNPSTGKKELYGEYLPNAQGEDVVAGIRTPLSLTVDGATPGREDQALERSMPAAFEAVQKHCDALERHFGDMQDVEFTIEEGRVYVLQTRRGKRAARAAVRIAVEMVQEEALSIEDALLTVDASGLDALLHARLPTPDELKVRGIEALASGLPASPGGATGKIVFDADMAVERAAGGEDVILVRRETSPEDIHGMKAAAGILTATGGMTSHAAVVARGLGKCCVAGCSDVHVNYAEKTVTIRGKGGETILREGDGMSLDGTHGKVYAGELEVVAAATVPELETIMSWADERRTMKVRANADTPGHAKMARAFGAEGIGLCRTEHMFFDADRLEAMRAMILAPSVEVRAEWLSKIEPMQRADFAAIFEAMDGLPVTVRLLDWPLHEFLPKTDAEFEQVAAALGDSEKSLRERAQQLHEINPMLGFRAVRVGLAFPEIMRMQTRALIAGALEAQGKGATVLPEIMVPVVGLASEVRAAVSIVRSQVENSLDGASLAYQIGTMIELPRACLCADEIAEHAEFFSFGTNDLTQTTFGISRDDAGRFLPHYLENGLIEHDPFAVLDSKVCELMSLAIERGRGARAGLKVGICGEHGGDPRSIQRVRALGLNYISCSPPRLPIARLAAAQSSIEEAKAK